MKRSFFWLLVLSFVVSGCSSSSETSLTTEEKKNFTEGMSAERVKEIGPAPKPPEGQLPTYQNGSAADKAQGR